MLNEQVIRTFREKNVLVTGGTGLIGRQVVDLMAWAGAKVRIVSLDRVNVHEKADHVFGDLTSFEFCKETTQDMDFVCHLAGIKGSIEVSKTHLASHFVPTLMINTNLLEAARVNKVGKLVYTSSIGAYADASVFRESDYRVDSMPMDFAGWAKRVAELQVYAYKVQFGMENFAIVRPSNVFGPGDNFDPNNAMVVPSIMSRIFRKEEVPLKIWGDGSAVRDFVYSRDVAEGVILALAKGTRGGFVNLGSGRGTSVRELAEALKSFIDFTYVFDTTKPSGPSKKVMDISVARETIGYNPSTSLRDGLKETWDWFLSHQDEYKSKKNYFKE